MEERVQMKIVSAACLAGLLWLTGCATTTPDTADTSATASQTGKTPQAPRPRPDTPFFPDGRQTYRHGLSPQLQLFLRYFTIFQ